MNNKALHPHDDDLTPFVVADVYGNRRIGYLNKDQKVCIPPIYYTRVNFPENKTLFNHDTNFKNHLAVVMNVAGKFGIISTDGNVVIELKYDALSNVIANDIVFFRDGATCGFMKLNGSVILQYPNCTAIQLKKETLYIIEYDDGKKKAEVDLSLIK